MWCQQIEQLRPFLITSHQMSWMKNPVTLLWIRLFPNYATCCAENQSALCKLRQQLTTHRSQMSSSSVVRCHHKMHEWALPEVYNQHTAKKWKCFSAMPPQAQPSKHLGRVEVLHTDSLNHCEKLDWVQSGLCSPLGVARVSTQWIRRHIYGFVTKSSLDHIHRNNSHRNFEH